MHANYKNESKDSIIHFFCSFICISDFNVKGEV